MVIAKEFLSSLSIVSTMVVRESSKWLGQNIVRSTCKRIWSGVLVKTTVVNGR